jgi:Fe-S oxidoreductase
MLHPTRAEVALLLLLAGVSLFFFARRLLPTIKIVRSCRADSGWEFGLAGKRIRDFGWEVLLQGKVIKERPLPGIAHAFVFWGFCAFALVTLDHFSRGFGFELISRTSLFGRAYFPMVAVFAVAVAASIAGLAIRRFIVRPVWLGTVSRESGLIAFLIFVLMITYLFTFMYPEGTPNARVNWWTHTVAILLFLPIIPHTKHLHLMLSPITIFLKRSRFSQIPPLEGDEDFGVESGKDVSWLMALQVFSCVECGRCTQHCPAKNTGKVLDPKGIALGVREYLKDHGGGGTEPLVGRYISEVALFQCTSCGACEYQCPVGIQHVPIIQGLRRGLVNTGKWEDEYGAKLFLALERNGNALGLAASERDRFIQKNELPIYTGEQDYCLWLGCMGSYDPQGREIIAALARVMTHLGVTFGVLKKERCTGDPVRRLGNDYLFQQLGEWNLEQIKEAKVVRMISICPHCVRTIGEDWAEAGATVQIEHHSEFLARHASRLPALDDAKITYHDPCYIGRYRGMYEQPRTVAARAGHICEPRLHAEDAFCCGAGGGRAFLGEELGKRVSVERAEQLAATGAETVVAACPFCNTMFRDALVQVSAMPPKLLDIAQIADASLRSKTSPPPQPS